MTLTMPKRLDFRRWSAEHIINGWDGYGDLDGCITRVRGMVNAPKVYAFMLMAAASMAQKVKDKKSGSPPSMSEEMVQIEMSQEIAAEVDRRWEECE